jgi:hypothetical protein
MSAYQRFLEFFSMHNKERLDGLDESYFVGMTQVEKDMAFSYLLNKITAGGTEESVHGIFLANKERASPILKELLKNGGLRDDAEIAAAWNLYRISPDSTLVSVFIRLMSSEDRRIRAKAAYYIPSNGFDPNVILALQGMIRTETDMLASINATNKLLECYGITRESVQKEEFSRFYRGLRSEDANLREITFKQLDKYVGL